MPDQLHTKYVLDESEMPKAWYNILPDLPRPLPPVLHPGTQKPVGPDDLAPLFPMALILQEVSQDRYIEIPDPVRRVYAQWRPSPLYRARRLEQALDTPARIYYKYEGISPVGSHKPNTAVPQVFYNREAGVRKISTETGAGQWGSSLAMAGAFFGVEIEVFMVKVSYHQKPFRRSMMEAYGATVHASPTNLTQAGRGILAKDPDSPGSLGIAISEAVEVAATSGGTVKYSLGSVLNHVLLHQTIVGEEALLQMAKADDYPDVVIGCVGGGSNMAGLILPFIRERLNRGLTTRFLAAEPTACPSMTRGVYAYDFGDTVGMTPLVRCTPSATTSCHPASTRVGCVITACPRSCRFCTMKGSSTPRPTPRTAFSRRRCCSPNTRGTSPRRKAPTPSAPPSMRPWKRSRPVRSA
jgi:tryptophan synthase beta chain